MGRSDLACRSNLGVEGLSQRVGTEAYLLHRKISHGLTERSPPLARSIQDQGNNSLQQQGESRQITLSISQVHLDSEVEASTRSDKANLPY